ncbi:MAG: class I SAM-dependent methyltransferase [Cytophagales bacterium]|nr:class I SAM-dependent methyltransferase [Cytophagales bacterium]
MNRTVSLNIIILLFWQVGHCQHKENHTGRQDANEYMHQTSHEELARIFDSSERDKWQKPDEVIRFLGEIEDKTVIDLGSGSGYFTFRLALAGAKVIAADIDRKFIEMINEKMLNYNLSHENIKTVQIHENELNIEHNTADIILLVNVYHHISDRVDYFRKANSVLKSNGKIVIVDFYKRSLPVGPPKNHKISKEEVIKELDEAGYKDIDVNTDLLEYQYIITTKKYTH